MSEHEDETVKQPIHLVEENAVDEKRQHTRVDINLEFRCIEDYISEYVSSMSPGGVFIRSKKPLPMGTKVTLKFSVIVDDIETVDGEGQVVRVDSSAENMGMGVAFTRLSADSKELIDRLMAKHEG
ncbi:MAG: PilZ domain-containing protein [Bradymonadaceae bacterium]